MRLLEAHPLIHGQPVLLKGYNPPMNTVHLAPNAPIVQKPTRATQSLLFQAQRKINKGQDRKRVIAQLQISTRRSPAVMAPPAAPAIGAGGGGYSGNVATSLGAAANPGFSTPAIPRPTPVT